VLIMNVDANAFIDLIKQNNQHDATQFSLINKEGFYISHSDQSKEWGSVHDLSHGHSFSEDYPELADSITQVTSLSSTESEQSLITSLPVYADTEQQHILGYLIAETPKKVALKLLNTFTIGFVAFILFAAVIGFVFARLLSTSMTAPLRQLTLAADKLSKGEVDTPIEIKSRDEIQFLAEAFERLRESVKLLMRM
jgi:HAMP domain-containing protein